ncbi:MBG domain-containing protein [Myroides sp. C15-4]|uniref:MBG domain-containing protein n=1 Tax=Myroides sp. C15-4 TaxID=3400532 RepID=UPI003D2F5A53
MNKKLLLIGFLLGMLFSAQLTQGQSYTPLAITSGFNEDVIAEEGPASTYTTAAVDATNSGANNAFMSKNYPDATVGLPENGLIHSIATATPGLSFQLADYDKKNSLKINADNGTGTLTVQTTQKLSILYILATSGSSVSTFTGTITFTDGTQQVFGEQSVPDWYDQGRPAIAIIGIGRVPRSGSENPDNNTTNPKLFQVAIDIDLVNQDKIIQQVAVIKTSSTSGFLNIFALSGEITPTCRKPVDLGIQNLTATSVELTWNSPGHAFDIKWGDRNFAIATAGTLVPGFANGGTLTGLTADRDYDYYVRQDCGVVDGVSTWEGPFQFRTGYCIPTGATNNPDEILNFTLSNLNNNSVTSEGTAGYKNYAGTVEPAVLEIGEAYVASLTSGRGTGLHGAAIWIDYNNNLVFDANEQVSVIGNTISPSTTVYFPSFTVPATVQPGLYRLRVQYHHNKPGADLDPCRLSRIYGETEDYRVEIIPAPTCFRPLDSRVQRVSKNSAHVVWDAPIQGDPPALGYKIEVRTSGRPGDATGLVRTLTTTNLSETITGLAIETDYLVYIQSLCSTTDESAWSKVAFTTLCDYPDYELTTDPTDLSFCGSRAVTLEVDTQGIVNWYDSETATTPIHTGNTYTTTVSATSSFWYQVVTPDTATIPTGPLDAEEVGPSRNNWIKEWGVYFTILEPTLLKSIDIYPTTAGQYGEMKFVQRGGTGATIGEINYTTVGDLTAEKQVVPINIRFEPGDYTIETNLPVDGILRNAAYASYPYSSAVASITGNEYQLSYYMGYYNWIFETGCKAIREEVVVTVMPSHSIANATVAVTATEGATLQITSAASSFTIEYGLRGFEQGTGTVVEGVGHSYGFSSLRGYTAYDVYIQAQPCGPLYGPLTFTTQAPTDTQVITVSDLSKNYGDLPFTTGSSDSGLPLSYQVENEAVAVFEQGQLVIKGAGTTRITASQGGDAQYVPAADVVFTLTVNKAMLTITAEANQQKVYGDPDPVFTFDVDGLQYEDDASIVTGLGRVAGEAVGTYPLEQENLTAGPNYEITFVGADFTITEAILTVTADAQTKAYGATDPALTYEVTGLQNGDQATEVLTGQLTRQVGEAVGTYGINQGSLVANTNYTLVYEGADFTITEAILTVTAETKTKVYGATDPALTYTVTGLQEGDDAATVLSGSLVRQVGESVGTYGINQGSLATTPNYTLVYEGADFTITEAILTVTAEPKTKAYGATDPVLTYTVTGLQTGDDAATVISGSLVRQVGEAVGIYGINQGSLVANANYTLVYEGADFTITEAILTVTAAAQTKAYGATDPVLTYAVTGLQAGDDAATVISGQLTRQSGEAVGTYGINQGSLVANANYTLVYEGADFTITEAILTVTAELKTKVYGATDPALTYAVTGLQTGDNATTVLSGSLVRQVGESVGTYAINQGNLTATANYTLVYEGADFTITEATLTVTAEPKTKVYGATDPALTYTVTGLQEGDDAATVISGQLTRQVGEAVGTYAINQGSLVANANYTLVYEGADFTITETILTVTAEPKTKAYGATDPVLTYTVTGLQTGDDAATVISGSLVRQVGEAVGIYGINQGSLVANANYTLVYEGADFTITETILTVTAEPKTKVYGATDPVLTYTVTGLQNGDQTTQVVTGQLSRQVGEAVGTYAINQGSLAATANYTLVYEGADFTISPIELVIYPQQNQAKEYGTADPILTFTAVGLSNEDTLATALRGALGRNTGENVGRYPYTLGSLESIGNNYVLRLDTTERFEITPTSIDIVVDAGQYKRHGQTDPVLRYTIQGLRRGDYPANVMTGQLEREAGEAVGQYTITQGSLAPRANYIIRSFTTATFEIKRAVIQGLSLPSKTVVYDGEAQYLEVEGSLDTGATVTYENNGQTQVGRYTVAATIANEPNYEPLRLVGTLTITPAEQYIRFGVVSTVVLEDTPSLPLQAVASSGLAVTYTIDDPAEQAIAQVDAAGVIYFLKPGFVTVTAHQEGNANYQAAVPVSRTIQVRSRDTTIENLVVDGVSYRKIPHEVYVEVGCEGLTNSVLIEVETAEGTLVFPSSTIVVELPEYGTYKQEIEVLAEDGIHRETYTVIIEKRMPWEGVLLQKYDNLVFVNNNSKTNGGYVFSKYEWYKNGQKVADKQLFSEGGTSGDLLDPTAAYYAVLYTSRGQVFTTCPMQVTRKNTYAMTVYPNPVDKNKPLTVRFDYPVAAFKTSEYTIYNTLGQFITKGQLGQAVSVIDLPFDLAAGAYILVIKVDGKPQSVRFIVK